MELRNSKLYGMRWTLCKTIISCFCLVFTITICYGQNTIKRPDYSGNKKVVKQAVRNKPAVKGNSSVKPMPPKAVANLSQFAPQRYPFRQVKECPVRDIRFYNDKNGGNVVCSVDIDSNLLLQQWAKAGESRFMSYNKWMSFFKEHDFIVKRNDLLQDTSARYPRVKAIHPYLGLLIELELKKSFSISEEGDSPTVFDEYSIEIL